jgi:hypothetical protein
MAACCPQKMMFEILLQPYEHMPDAIYHSLPQNSPHIKLQKQ